MGKVFISVIVPVYNGERTISRCIESLLNQDYPKKNYEIIIVDNNSKDRTAHIIKSYNVKYLLEDRIQTSYAARNTGIRAAKGSILAFTDSDCVASRHWLSEAVKFFSNSNIGCVAGNILGYSPHNFIEKYFIDRGCFDVKRTLENSWFLPFAPTANVFYRKEVFEKIGLFESYWKSGGDVDLCWRMQLFTNYQIAYAEKAIIYHIHRSTLKSFLKQRKTWGIGRALLQKKYKNFLPKYPITYKIKASYWEIYTILVLAIKTLFNVLRRKPNNYDLLNLLGILAFNLGIIEGRVFHGKKV